ncbi:glycosyltransferase family 4 protein [Planktothricoides raciborskii]|nr:glycosyltransferase family 4 protein [Planktothricoides raciborskii]
MPIVELKNMKITFIAGNWVNLSGGNRVIAIYAERLKKRGHEVFVVCPSKQKPSLYQQVRSIVKGKGLIPMSKNGPSHFDNTDIPRVVLEHGPPVTDADIPDADVVVATWWETAEWVANLSREKGAKAYFVQHHEVHDYFTPEQKERAKATYLLPMHKITISQWLVDLMQTCYGDANVSLVFNSVDTDQFHTPARGKQATPTIGMLYSPVPWKGCDISFKAFSLAAQKIPNLRLVAFGSKEPSPDLPLPSETQYIRQPAQKTIKDIYAQCDVWLCGSRAEGFHLPPLEAMACRCPVVSTEVGGPIDIIENGVNGYLVPVDDFTGLANHLIHILSLSDGEWQAMSDAAYATAINYTWDDATELFEKALYTAIDRDKC